MTETPGQPTDPAPEQQSNVTPEPTPAATTEPTNEPVTEPTPAATTAAHPTWHWPENRRNRIAASAAIVAGAVAVVVASFTGGFVTGAHAVAGHQARWAHHSEMSAYPEHTGTGQIWIIPGAQTTQGQGYIIAESG